MFLFWIVYIFILFYQFIIKFDELIFNYLHNFFSKLILIYTLFLL